MKILKLATLAAVVALGMAAPANAALYNLSFTSTTDSTAANGWVTTDASGLALSGSLTLTSGAYVGESFALIPGSWFSSPHGAFNADNQVFPSYNPFVDYWGLLFGKANVEFNLWGNGVADSYTLYGWAADTGYFPQAVGTATLTAVPEPSTILAAVMLFVPFGASSLRAMRKNKA